MNNETNQNNKAEAAGRDDGNMSAAGDAANEKLTEASADILDQALREKEEYLESLQRLQAEFANFRSRVARESSESSDRASSEIVEDLLPVLDNFERAINSVVEHDKQVLGEGVELVYRQLREVLDRRGLCEIDAHGEDFDPSHHEAVLCQPSTEHEEGKVVDVLEKGYSINEIVVRPAKVIVSDGDPSDTGK